MNTRRGTRSNMEITWRILETIAKMQANEASVALHVATACSLNYQDWYQYRDSLIETKLIEARPTEKFRRKFSLFRSVGKTVAKFYYVLTDRGFEVLRHYRAIQELLEPMVVTQ